FLADVRRLAVTETSPAQEIRERFALDEIHPEADAAVVHVGAVDGHHVWMPDAGEAPRFVKNARRKIGSGDGGLEELQRDRVIQPGVAGAGDPAERPLPARAAH